MRDIPGHRNGLLKFGDGFVVTSHRKQAKSAEHPVREHEVRVELQRFPQLLLCGLELACKAIDETCDAIYEKGNRIRRQGARRFLDGFRVSSQGAQEQAIDVVSIGVVRTKLNGAAEGFFCPGPIPVKVELDSTETDVRLGKGFIQLEGPGRSRLRSRNELALRYELQDRVAKLVKRIGQSGVGERIARIFRNRLRKVLNALPHTLFRGPRPVVTALQVGFVSSGIYRPRTRQPRPLLGSQLGLN